MVGVAFICCSLGIHKENMQTLLLFNTINVKNMHPHRDIGEV